MLSIHIIQVSNISFNIMKVNVNYILTKNQINKGNNK